MFYNLRPLQIDMELTQTFLAIMVFFGARSSADNRLISEFANATQSSNFDSQDSDKWSAQKAIDGCCNESRCVARTKGENENWIQIDLRNIYKVSMIVIHAVTNVSCPSCSDTGIKKLDVTMSKIKDYPQCVRTNVSTESAKSMVIIRQTNNNYSLPDSRFITLRKKYQELIIAEVEVFGECLDNYCGRNCSEFCFCKTPLSSEEKANGQRCSNGCLDGWQGERCNKSKCSKGKFGLDCHYQCRCWKNCDPWTGECLGTDKRCRSGWFGPSCQRQKEDLFYPVHDTNINMLSDGNTSTCYYVHMWMKRDLIKFSKPRSISHVEITYSVPKPVSPQIGTFLELQSTNGDVFHERFKRDISNPFGCDDKQQEILLFNDAENISGVAVKNVVVTLCEISFYRCSPGFFGLDCNSRCHCAYKSACNTYDGACPNGSVCESGWSGNACDKKCATGTFGAGCTGVCYCRYNEPCHHLTGKCPNGCNPGWFGDSCNKKCPVDWFGPQCQHRCGNCEGNNKCHHITGNCSEGCVEGWEGPRCLKDKQSPDDYKYEPVEDLDISSMAPNQTKRNCTKCEGTYKETEEGSSSMLIAYGILGASLLILILLTTLAVVYGVRRRRDRQSKSVYSYVARNEMLHDTPVVSSSEQVQQEVVEVDEIGDTEQIDVEADVLDDAVLKIYDDDFVLDSDPNGPIPLGKLWGHIQALKNDNGMLLKEFAEAKFCIGRVNAMESYLKPVIQADRKITVVPILSNSFKPCSSAAKSLPIGVCDSVNDASQQENKRKNRYNGVYPYDFNRVKLARDAPSTADDEMPVYGNMPLDYINASYFDGYGKEKAYIVTQGPLEWTRGDFWEMIWQERTTQIVMLTNLVEDRKIKCCKYWPDEGKAHFGRVSIKHVFSSELPDFTVTRLQIRMGEENEPRIVHHYHYQTWPDKGIPDSAWNLVNFWRQVRSSSQKSDGPLVVHCSAGVGRSGTYVGLDYLYNQAIRKGSVRMFDCVRSMRRQRINMVQTKHQYLFLHEIVAEAVHCGSLPVDQQIFQEYIDDLDKVEDKTGKTNMQIQYENLCEGIAYSLSEEEEQIYANNRSVHIQALHLKNFQGNEAYLVDQSCYVGEDEDFWRNIYNLGSKTIVTFEHLKMDASWLETGVPKQLAEIELVQVAEETKETFIRRVLTLQFEGEEPYEVHLFEATFWKGEVQFGYQEILNFTDEISSWQKSQTEIGTIVLQYGDDPSQIGLFLVLYDDLERLHYKSKIGLFETVWEFKTILPNIIPDFQQYQLCYTAVSERQKAGALYYNM